MDNFNPSTVFQVLYKAARMLRVHEESEWSSAVDFISMYKAKRYV